jgi:hypothetical protein
VTRLPHDPDREYMRALTVRNIRYKLTREELAMGRPETPPKLGTDTPPPPYGVHGPREKDNKRFTGTPEE